MKSIFKNILKGKVVIVGIGNILRGDDAVGPELIKRLKLKIKNESQIELLDVGEAPENYLEKIVKQTPDTVLLIDAVDFGGSAGSVTLLEQESLKEDGLTTHNASLKLTIKYLKERSINRIFIIGVQPEQIKFGGGLSKSVDKTLNQIKEEIIKCMN